MNPLLLLLLGGGAAYVAFFASPSNAGPAPSTNPGANLQGFGSPPPNALLSATSPSELAARSALLGIPTTPAPPPKGSGTPVGRSLVALALAGAPSSGAPLPYPPGEPGSHASLPPLPPYKPSPTHAALHTLATSAHQAMVGAPLEYVASPYDAHGRPWDVYRDPAGNLHFYG
jgi:hypothetical protein